MPLKIRFGIDLSVFVVEFDIFGDFFGYEAQVTSLRCLVFSIFIVTVCTASIEIHRLPVRPADICGVNVATGFEFSCKIGKRRDYLGAAPQQICAKPRHWEYFPTLPKQFSFSIAGCRSLSTWPGCPMSNACGGKCDHPARRSGRFDAAARHCPAIDDSQDFGQSHLRSVRRAERERVIGLAGAATASGRSEVGGVRRRFEAQCISGSATFAVPAR